MSAIWTMTMSSKSRRQGEVFVKRREKFAFKIYKDGVEDPIKFGRFLVRQLNRLEAVKEARTLQGCVHDYQVEGDIENRLDGSLYLKCSHCGHVKE